MQNGKELLERMMEMRAYLASPASHFTHDVGIKRFKRKVKHLPKSARNQAIADYKQKAWNHFHENMGHDVTFPTHKGKYCI